MRQGKARYTGLFLAVNVLLMLSICPNRSALAGTTVDSQAGRKENVRPPRLFFTPQKIEQLMQRIERDERARDGWRQIKQRADRQLTRPS